MEILVVIRRDDITEMSAAILHSTLTGSHKVLLVPLRFQIVKFSNGVC